MKFKGLKVGDEVVIRLHRVTLRQTVEKVGRKYFNAGGSVFRLEDGTSTSGYSTPHAYTIEEHERTRLTQQARDAMRAWGLDVGYGTKQDLILVTHQALVSAGLLSPLAPTNPH